MRNYANVMILNFNEANHAYSVGNEPRGNDLMKQAERLFNLMSEAEFLKAREMLADDPRSQWDMDEIEVCFEPARVIARLEASK